MMFKVFRVGANIRVVFDPPRHLLDLVRSRGTIQCNFAPMMMSEKEK